jgi:hypothetical protein
MQHLNTVGVFHAKGTLVGVLEQVVLESSRKNENGFKDSATIPNPKTKKASCVQ